MGLSIDDLGFLQGVTAVERMRTWNRGLPLLEAHLVRFFHTTQTLKIAGLPSDDRLIELIGELLGKHESDSETGIVLFATPGRRGSDTPTLGMHLSPLDFPRLERLRDQGQSLVITSVRQPPLDCWPRDIKVRSRIHYYLADQQARERDPEALGVLIDDDGSITETSVSNVLAVAEGRLIAPPAGRILPGVMLSTVIHLARAEGIPVERAAIGPETLRAAEEVLLTGSEAGLWPARQVDDIPKPPGPICRRLQPLLDAFLAAAV